MLEHVRVHRAVRRVRAVGEPVDEGLQELVLEVAARVCREHLVDLGRIQILESQAQHVGQDAASRGGDLRPQPIGDPRRRVQRDRRPDGIGGAGGEPVVEQELARVVGAVDLEPLLLVGVGRREAGVVEERGEVEQLRIRLQAVRLGVDHPEEEHSPGVVEDQLAGRLPDRPSRLHGRCRVRDLHPCDDLGHRTPPTSLC